MIMARHLTAQGIADPCALTKAQLNRYLLAQYQERKPGGGWRSTRRSRSSSTGWPPSTRPGTPSPAIPRPKGGSEAVPVVQPDQIGAILTACKDKTAAGTARNTAVIWLLIESACAGSR